MDNAAPERGQLAGNEPPRRYARGWHCLGLSAPFKDGRPHTLEIFGTKLVAFEQADGRMAVLDGYCPHMGADLGTGAIIEGTVACPFHGWQWNGKGECAHIPYSPRIPRKAKTKSWPVMEQNEQLFVYHDPEQKPPPSEVAIPAIDAVVNGECTPWEWQTIHIPANCRELIDNVADAMHFKLVHGLEATRFANVFERHMATQSGTFQALSADDGRGNSDGTAAFSFESTATYYGPAYMIVSQTVDHLGKPVELYLINAHYPITPTSFALHIGITTRRIEGVSTDESIALGRAVAKAAVDTFLQDVGIWQTKARIDAPVLTEFCGPIYQLRRWYEQFYVDAADVVPAMTDRFEYEVDLRTPNQMLNAAARS